MRPSPAKKLGKLSLAILENFIQGKLGEKFIKELRQDYDITATIASALENAETRFLKEFEDKDLSRAMFVDLSQKDRPELQNAVIEFYQHPSRSNFNGVLCDILLGEFKSLSRERIEQAISTYVAILTEELAMLDTEFREKVSFLKDFRQAEKTTKPRPSSKRKKETKGSYQIPPLPPQGVFGRDDAISKVAEFLVSDDHSIVDLPPLALRGMGGIGKTTLAIAFAHEYKAKFPDGVLWTSLGPKPTARLVLDAWGRSLGLDLLPERDEVACQNRLRQFLHDKQVLVIIDDVWDTIQGGYFLVGGPHCRTLITTRELPVANDLATRERVLRVDVLKPMDALALLQKLAPETTQVDKALCIKLCERLEFLPLAITLAGRMLANEADVPQRMQRLVGELIERRDSRLQLVQAEGRQGLDDENPVSLQAILGMSVDRLDKADQERFAMLSIFGGEPLTWELKAVSAVWETSMEETEATISRFIQRGLVEPRDGRYWMHALLADYGAELMKKMEL
ncbi:MAG: hypothetical protein HRF47_08780 [Chloroflexota bacterium]|jgi:hypothetical protein